MNLTPTNVLVAILLLALAGLLLKFFLSWRKTNYSLLQYLLWLVNYSIVRLYWRGEVKGELPIGDHEGAIIICNHRSPVDPSFVQVLTHRVVHWMIAKEYCEQPLLAKFLKLLESIPVSRAGKDNAAIKQALQYAKDGQLVGVFPEGRINTTNDILMPGRPGVALIALKAKVPIIPCYISGSPQGKSILSSVIKPARVRIVIGEKMDVSEFYGKESDKETLEEVTRRFLKEIARLAGEQQYEPSLAGRNWKPGN